MNLAPGAHEMVQTYTAQLELGMTMATTVTGLVQGFSGLQFALHNNLCHCTAPSPDVDVLSTFLYLRRKRLQAESNEYCDASTA